MDDSSVTPTSFGAPTPPSEAAFGSSPTPLLAGNLGTPFGRGTARQESLRLLRGFVKQPPSDIESTRVQVRNHIVMKNPHLRKFRNFALAFIAFRSNVRDTLELGRHRRPKEMLEDNQDIAAANEGAEPSSSLNMAKYLANEVVRKVGGPSRHTERGGLM